VIVIPAAILAFALFLAPLAPIFGAVGAGAGVYGDIQRQNSVTVNRKQWLTMQRDVASLKREVAQLRLIVRKQHVGFRDHTVGSRKSTSMERPRRHRTVS
jgi:hypothetical protein